ncbi:hypothetical protein MNBD_PLANCTO02-16, partial [hydrothermal vent metagenome]
GLCQPADLRRCRKQVKRLVRDLPAFDSVWIDALLYNRKLTTYQAKQLESAHPQRLQVQSYLLIEPLGNGYHAQTFLARKQNGKEVIVLKQIDIPQGTTETTQEKLLQLTEQFSRLVTPFVISPKEVFEDLGQLVTICEQAKGVNLHELLIRRGRFPAEVVLSLCRQIAEGLSHLENRQLIHGDLQLKNIRLSSSGQTVLVDAGIKQALNPELIIRADSAPSEYDGIAPELIGTGNLPTAASDRYALGCLLWQLLAGRPPFSTGDPLSKLALHQTKRISNVSQWAPETPEELTNLIAVLTSPSSSERPVSWRDVVEKIGTARHRDKKTLAQFVSRFSTEVNETPTLFYQGASSKPKRSFMQSRWGVMVLLFFVSTGAVLTLMDKGARAKTLSIFPRSFSTDIFSSKPASDNKEIQEKKSLQQTVEKDSSVVAKHSKLLRLPEPDAAGVIQLTETGPYAAADISTVGPLHIRGVKGKQPRILVENKSCKIWAEQLILENVHFVYAGEGNKKKQQKPLAALLLVQSQDIALFGCSFRSQQNLSHNKRLLQPLSVAWRPIEPNDNGSRRVIVERTIFANGSALFLQSSPQSFFAKNCLKTGRGSFLVLGHPPKKGKVVQYRLNRVTLRDATALLETGFTSQDHQMGQTVVEMNQSVFQLNKKEGTLFLFSSREFPKQWVGKYEVTGEGTLAGNNLSIAKWYETTTKKKRELDSQNMPLEGLVGGVFQFAGDDINQPDDCVVKKWQAPLRSAQPPGINAKHLPQ